MKASDAMGSGIDVPDKPPVNPATIGWNYSKDQTMFDNFQRANEALSAHGDYSTGERIAFAQRYVPGMSKSMAYRALQRMEYER